LRERLAVREKVVEQLKAALEETESAAEAEAEAARTKTAALAKELAQLREKSSALAAVRLYKLNPVDLLCIVPN
jgi:hypothetical protein